MEEAEIKAEFGKRSEDYKELSFVAVEILRNALEGENIKTAYVTSRIKSLDSFLDKTNRKKFNAPFEKINDVVGIRVVYLYTEDKDKIDKMIGKEFTVIDRDDKREKLGSDKMGYQDLSFVVSLPTQACDPKRKLYEVKFEIQVRPIMSDAMSIVYHDLCYKKESFLPKSLLRDMNNLFSVMEVAQSQCDTIRERRKEYIEQIKAKSEDPNQADFLAQPITDDTLRVYTNKYFSSLPIKENIHALILRDVDPNKYKILKDINNAMEYSKRFIDYYKTQSDSFKSGSDYITKSLGFYDDDFLKRHPFAQKTREAIGEFKKKMAAEK